MFWIVLNGHDVETSELPESDVVVGSVFVEVSGDGVVRVSCVILKLRWWNDVVGVVNEDVEDDEVVNVVELYHVVDGNGTAWIGIRICAVVIWVRCGQACLEVVDQQEPVVECHWWLWT